MQELIQINFLKQNLLEANNAELYECIKSLQPEVC